MSYFSKEVYEKKREWASAKHSKNKQIGINNGLTEEQCDVLEELCSIRHKIHSTDARKIFSTESAEFDEISDYLDCDMFFNENVYEIAENVGLPHFSPVIGSLYEQICDYTDNEWFEFMTDEDKEPFIQQAINDFNDADRAFDCFFEYAVFKISDLKEKINVEFEKYLADIDKRYKTEYCPTGFARAGDLNNYVAHNEPDICDD